MIGKDAMAGRAAVTAAVSCRPVTGYFHTAQASRAQTRTCIKCRREPAAAGSLNCAACYAANAAIGIGSTACDNCGKEVGVPCVWCDACWALRHGGGPGEA